MRDVLAGRNAVATTTPAATTRAAANDNAKPEIIIAIFALATR